MDSAAEVALEVAEASAEDTVVEADIKVAADMVEAIAVVVVVVVALVLVLKKVLLQMPSLTSLLAVVSEVRSSSSET